MTEKELMQAAVENAVETSDPELISKQKYLYKTFEIWTENIDLEDRDNPENKSALKLLSLVNKWLSGVVKDGRYYWCIDTNLHYHDNGVDFSASEDASKKEVKEFKLPNAFKEVSEKVFYGDLRDITARIYDNGAIEIEWYQSTECLIPEKLISKENESIMRHHLMRHHLREDALPLPRKQHQALIDTINRCDAELVYKEEILEDWREVMTEDFDKEDPSFALEFKLIDNLISQLGSALKDGERYYWARDTYYPSYEDEEFNEFDYFYNVKHTSTEVKLTPEEIKYCKDNGGDWLHATATVFEDGVVGIDWDTYLGYGDCFIPERLVRHVKRSGESDYDDEVNELDLDF